ncbi:hypothetical protein LDENG_00144070 [Lucifuga dentata]|nr:hypothetical protein LDENG_00144070 [Lucifuga dentata]
MSTLTMTMTIFYIPVLEICLSILGFGLTIMFCTAICKACHRFREEREEWRRNQETAPPPIYFIQYPGSMSQPDSEDYPRLPQCNQDPLRPPRYSTTGYCGPPPSYNECISAGTYSEYSSVPVCPIIPSQHTDVVQPQTQSTS